MINYTNEEVLKYANLEQVRECLKRVLDKNYEAIAIIEEVIEDTIAYDAPWYTVEALKELKEILQ